MEEEGRIRKSIENILYNLQNAGFMYEGETKEIYNNIKKYNDTNKEVLDFVVKNNEKVSPVKILNVLLIIEHLLILIRII